MKKKELWEQISEQANSAIELVRLQQSIEKSGLIDGAPAENTDKAIATLRDRINTELQSTDSNKNQRAYGVLTDYLNSKDKNPTVAAVFECMQMPLYQEAKKTNANLVNPKLDKLTQQFDALQKTVTDFKGEANRTLNAGAADNKEFVGKEREKVNKLISQAEGIIDKHRQFGTDSSLSQAKKELKQEFNNYQRSIKVESFFTAIKEAVEKVINKITTTGLPSFAKQAMEQKVAPKVDKSTTLKNLESDVKTVTSSMGSKR